MGYRGSQGVPHPTPCGRHEKIRSCLELIELFRSGFQNGAEWAVALATPFSGHGYGGLPPSLPGTGGWQGRCSQAPAGLDCRAKPRAAREPLFLPLWANQESPGTVGAHRERPVQLGANQESPRPSRHQ